MRSCFFRVTLAVLLMTLWMGNAQARGPRGRGGASRGGGSLPSVGTYGGGAPGGGAIGNQALGSTHSALNGRGLPSGFGSGPANAAAHAPGGPRVSQQQLGDFLQLPRNGNPTDAALNRPRNSQQWQQHAEQVRASALNHASGQPQPFTAAWYAQHPNAWQATHPYAPYAAATWALAATWVGLSAAQPVVYDYGSDTVVYQTEATDASPQANQAVATQLAAAGQAAEVTLGEWLPLGVYALAREKQPEADHLLQLAINQKGVVSGNFFSVLSAHEQPLSGTIDRASQRVAFSVTSNPQRVYETSLAHLTQHQSPIMVHLGNNRSERWTLVRLQDESGSPTTQP